MSTYVVSRVRRKSVAEATVARLPKALLVLAVATLLASLTYAYLNGFFGLVF